MANCQTDPRYSNCVTAGDMGFPDKHADTDMLKQRVYGENELEAIFI